MRTMVMALLLVLGLSQHAYSFYNPSIGRWLSRDPIGEKGGVNLYGFVKNDSLTHIDPDGRTLFTPTGDLLQLAGGVCCNYFSGYRTEGEANRRGNRNGDERYGGNAYLHCVATCRAARACGLTAARDFWTRREPRGTPDGDMDLANNAVGYGITGDCWRGCMDAWRNGRLTCLGERGEPITCPVPPRHIQEIENR